MTAADIRKRAHFAKYKVDGDLLRAFADVVVTTRHALDYLLEDDYKTADLRAALARVEALTP